MVSLRVSAGMRAHSIDRHLIASASCFVSATAGTVKSIVGSASVFLAPARFVPFPDPLRGMSLRPLLPTQYPPTPIPSAPHEHEGTPPLLLEDPQQQVSLPQ